MKDFAALKSLWKERDRERLGALIVKEVSDAKTLFLTSSSDLGVCRNGGRRGSRFAPQAISAVLKKMVAIPGTEPLCFREVACRAREEENFVLSQEESADCIRMTWDRFGGERIFHVGGGHDHIFPLLMSLKDCGSIHVINIDAHLDTRAEPLVHSGTPFRQFAALYGGRFRLTQLGIHHFSNPPSALEDLSAEMTVLSPDELEGGDWRERILLDREDMTLLSLDCDAIAAETMEAVSAVNPAGLPLGLVREIFDWYRKIDQKQKVYGIYEYNPLFDNLSQKGARTLASLIYAALQKG